MVPQIYIGSFALQSYGICMAAGFTAAFLLSLRRVRKRGGSYEQILMIAAAALLAAFALARITFRVFSYGTGRLLREMAAGDVSGCVRGGFVWYGGLIGGIAGALILIRVCRLDLDVYACSIVPCIPLGHAFGRLGCLLAGCCYGLPYEGPLAVRSAQAGLSQTLFPIQAVEALCDFILFAILSVYTRKPRNGLLILGIYLILYSIARFVIEFFRGDTVRGIWLGFSTSQWIAVFLILACPIMILCYRKRISPPDTDLQE